MKSLYSVYNKIVEEYDQPVLFNNDKMAAITITTNLTDSKYNLDNWKIYKVGEFDSENGKIKSIEPAPIDWDFTKLTIDDACKVMTKEKK